MRHLILSDEARARLVEKLDKWKDWATRGLKPFHAHLRDMDKVYDAKPESKTKTMPYQGAPNYVIPAVAIEVDSLAAKEKSRFFQSDPVWTKKGLTQDQSGIEELREAQETFLNYVATEPGQMDIYPVYDTLLPSKTRRGMAVLKMPWVRREEVLVQDDGQTKMFTASNGPKPYLVPLENMLFHPTDLRDEDDAEILGEIIPLNYERVMERRRDMVYYSAAVDAMLNSPDDDFDTPIERQQQQHAHVDVPPDDKFSREWKPVEFWMRWYIGKGEAESVDDQDYKLNEGSFPEDKRIPVEAGYYHLIVSFHQRSRQLLRVLLNHYPQNIHPYVFWYLQRMDGTSVGKGYAEMLEESQRMQSEGKSQRAANIALANCRIWVGKNKLANQSRMMYPNAFWVTDNPQQDIQSLQMADVYPSSFEEESANWELISRITGNPQANQGSGAGQVSKTTGTYTALPALAAMQAGNTRGDIRICDSQYFHMRVGRKAQLMYSHFGISDELLQRFGTLGQAIKDSFTQESLNRLLIPTRAATSSNNIEVDRQNQQLIDGKLAEASQQLMSLVIAAGNPATPPVIAEYAFNWAISRTRTLRLMTKAFNQDDTNRLVPDPPAGGNFAEFRQQTQPPPMAPPAGGPAVPPPAGGPPGARPPGPGVPVNGGGPGGPPIPGQHPPMQLAPGVGRPA